jgi:malonyl-CoA O-methyltransferase
MVANSDPTDDARSDFTINLKPSSQPLPVVAGYDRWAATYDSVANPTRAAAAAHLRAQPFALHGARVLELGCGTGLDTQWLAERAAEVVALDFAPAMLEIARRRLDASHVRFLAHDIAHPLPIGDGLMDLVVENLVLEHMAEIAGLFAEIRRVLRPGGVFAMCELHPYRQLMGTQARFVDPETAVEQLIEAYPHTIAEFTNAAIAAGLTPVRLGEEASDAAGFPRIFSLAAIAA